MKKGSNISRTWKTDTKNMKSLIEKWKHQINEEWTNGWLGATGEMPLLEVSTLILQESIGDHMTTSGLQECEKREVIRKCMEFSRGAGLDLFQTSQREQERGCSADWLGDQMSQVGESSQKNQRYLEAGMWLYWEEVGGWAHPLGTKFNSSRWTAVFGRVLGEGQGQLCPALTGHRSPALGAGWVGTWALMIVATCLACENVFSLWETGWSDVTQGLTKCRTGYWACFQALVLSPDPGMTLTSCPSH